MTTNQAYFEFFTRWDELEHIPILELVLLSNLGWNGNLPFTCNSSAPHFDLLGNILFLEALHFKVKRMLVTPHSVFHEYSVHSL